MRLTKKDKIALNDALKTDAGKLFESLRVEAIADTQREVTSFIVKFAQNLDKYKGELSLVAPHPIYGELSQREFNEALHLYNFAQSITVNKHGFYFIDNDKIIEYIENKKNEADYRYSKFIIRIVNKIGDYKKVELRGNHIWGRAFLHVVKKDNKKEVWQIMSVVKTTDSGKVYVQYQTKRQR